MGFFVIWQKWNQILLSAAERNSLLTPRLVCIPSKKWLPVTVGYCTGVFSWLWLLKHLKISCNPLGPESKGEFDLHHSDRIVTDGKRWCCHLHLLCPIYTLEQTAGVPFYCLAVWFLFDCPLWLQRSPLFIKSKRFFQANRADTISYVLYLG